MKVFRAFAFAVLIGSALVSVARGQTGPFVTPQAQNSDEVSALRRDLDALKQEVERLKGAVHQQPRTGVAPAPANLSVRIDGAPSQGDPAATVTIVEFSDFQCPFCARHARDTMPQLKKDYIETGKVKYVVRDFPLESIHKDALRAAEAARCAGEQGKYWAMHDLLFANQKALAASEVSGLSGRLGLDVKTFDACVESGRFAALVRKDQAEAATLGVTGTPTLFIGLTEPNSPTVKVLRVLRGAQPYPALKFALDDVLARR